MSNAIGSSLEANPSRIICNLRAVPLGHLAYVLGKAGNSAILLLLLFIFFSADIKQANRKRENTVKLNKRLNKTFTFKVGWGRFYLFFFAVPAIQLDLLVLGSRIARLEQ